MVPGARSKFGAHMFEPEVFPKQMYWYCIEESTCDIVGTFLRSPQSFCALTMIRRPGNCSPFALLVTPLDTVEAESEANVAFTNGPEDVGCPRIQKCSDLNF